MKYLLAQIAALSPRPTTIHANPCAQCPSVAYVRDKFEDPSMEEARDWPRAEQVESAFPCAWRTQKLCKGYCDYLNVTETDLCTG
jgi:hypothetical protein